MESAARSGATGVSLLAAAGPAVGAVVALPLGPWVEFRRKRAGDDHARVARTLSAWSVTGKATIAALTALWGLLAGITGLRTAIAIAGLLMMATPLLLPRHDRTSQHEPEPAPEHT
ncbi:hypothetical protein [Streptomyces sp. NPDC054849]